MKASLPISESKHLTTNLSFKRSIQGMNCSRWIPFLYNSSGCRLVRSNTSQLQNSRIRKRKTNFEVITATTPYAIILSSNLLKIIASTISVTYSSPSVLSLATSNSQKLTWNSSKHNTLASIANSLAIGTIQSARSPFSIFILCPRLCTSIIKA